jgi:hypothetical protein
VTTRERLSGLVGGLTADGWSVSEKKAQALIGSYHVQQRQITFRGRSFHFVSYAGTKANVRRGEPAGFATWFLMSAGTRWEVAPQLVGEEPADTDRRLLEWLERTMVEPAPPATPVTKTATRGGTPWERAASPNSPRFGD